MILNLLFNVLSLFLQLKNPQSVGSKIYNKLF